MPSILIVCTANICRSPMAEAILQHKLAEAGVPGEWRVGSAGTWAQNGLPASENGVAVMRERGLDTSRHRSRVVTAGLLAGVDLALTMTASHAESLCAEFPQEAHKVFRLTEMTGRPYNVQDPYGSSAEHYRRTADELEDLIERGLSKIITLAQSAPR